MCQENPTLDASDKTTVLRNTAKEVHSSVYIAFKYIIIVKNISLNNHNERNIWSTGLAHCYGVAVSEFSLSFQLQTINL